MVRQGHRQAAGEEDRGVDRRQAERGHRFEGAVHVAADVARTLACYHRILCARVADHGSLVRMAEALDARMDLFFRACLR